MIYKATRLIAQEMDQMNIKYSIDESDEHSIINAGFGIENGPNVVVRFISTDDDNDVAIRLYNIVTNVSESKLDSMMKVVNECNHKYRYLKFLIDDERDVNLEYDILQHSSDDSVGPEAYEFFIRIMNIMDEIYPLFMKVIWS